MCFRFDLATDYSVLDAKPEELSLTTPTMRVGLVEVEGTAHEDAILKHLIAYVPGADNYLAQTIV